MRSSAPSARWRSAPTCAAQKIRVGMVEGGTVHLEAGQEIVIQREAVVGDARRLSTTLPELADAVLPGQQIQLNDGPLVLEVVRTDPPEKFVCRILVGGALASGKGMNFLQTSLAISPLTEKDRRDIDWIAQRDFDYVALSFVRTAADVAELRALLEERSCSAHIISKIEKPEALDDIDAIIDASDAVMVARGDLGVELDYARVPVVQKLIARKCEMAGKCCIIATEMLESMIPNSRPTRAEVSDVANAVFDHADAVMLSGESAVGRYPVEAVTAMLRIVPASEGFLHEYGRRAGRRGSAHRGDAGHPGGHRLHGFRFRRLHVIQEPSQLTGPRSVAQSGDSSPLLPVLWRRLHGGPRAGRPE